ncbi:MAG TPA: hypothetical protein VHD63_16775 [Ktedonobacteraceae bacterium]|nr:hypothetical protein [Ktedonobacteraceae bacterium]
MEQEQKRFELSAQEAIDIVRTYPEAHEGDAEIVGAIFDQDEVETFLRWLCGPEAKAIREQIRAQRLQGEEP